MFIDLSFLMIWLLLPLFWGLLMKLAGLNLTKPNIPVTLIIFIYVFQYIGLPILYFQLDAYRFSEGVNDKVIVLNIFLFTSITITLMIFGYVVAKLHFGRLNWNKEYVDKTNITTSFAIFIFFTLSVSVLLLYITKLGVNNLAILSVVGLVDNSDSLALLRSSMGNNFSGRYHWYYLFMNKILIFISYIYYVMFLSGLKYSKVMFYMSLLAVLVSLTMATAKGPLINYLIGIFIINIIVSNEKIKIKKVFAFMVALIVILVMMYILFMNNSSVFSALWHVTSRITTGQIQPAYHYLEFFPYYQDFLLGRSFPNPAGILPFEHYRLTHELMAWHNPSQASRGVVGSMPTIYWGEMYANFGWLGVLVVPLIVGYVLYGINSVLFRFKKNMITISYFVWIIMHISSLSGTSLSNYFVDIYMVVTTIVFFILYFLNGSPRTYKYIEEK